MPRFSSSLHGNGSPTSLLLKVRNDDSLGEMERRGDSAKNKPDSGKEAARTNYAIHNTAVSIRYGLLLPELT